jgi:isocitrate dehydrogenase
MRVVDKATGKPLMEHQMGAGDIFRACQTKDESIKDWVGLAVKRGRATGSPAIFWLDKDRAHDANMIGKVNTYLKDHDLTGVELFIKNPVDAVRIRHSVILCSSFLFSLFVCV